MKKVALYSGLLLAGLALSQLLPPQMGDALDAYSTVVRLLVMFGLSFIMIHVGYEFDIDKSNVRQYGWDYVVAATAAAFPWIFCCLYFVFVLLPETTWSLAGIWKESLLASRFSAPTSAGVLFSMLAAAGLATTWVFKKARILAIFDDLDTVLLMIPLKMAMVGLKWQLGVIVLLMAAQLWLAWKFLHTLKIPISFGWCILYAALIAGTSEVIYAASKVIDPQVPVHIEVLLPAFVLGCVIARQRSNGQYVSTTTTPTTNHHHDDILESPKEKRASTVMSAFFMVMVGLAMPMFINQIGATPPAPTPAAATTTGDTATTATITADSPPELISQTLKVGDYLATLTQPMTWGQIALHVLVITILSNLGKMFPAFCYRREASWRQRLAVAIGMWPRGEVGAGVLAVSIGYGIGGPIVVIAMLSLALNLVLTGVFIIIIKRLLAADPTFKPTDA
jgi:Kef-type K+ transport system membrane component KefB